MHATSHRALTCLLATLCFCSAFGQTSDALYEGFRNPPAQYRPLPLWYWNSKIDSAVLKRQIDDYVARGAQGAVVYPAVGLRTRFLSEEWWRVWAEMLPYARQKGFKLGWVPEFNHPNGDARDMWLDPPDQSLVVRGHPEFRMKRLTFIEREFAGPGRARFEGLPNPVIAVAARQTDDGSLDASSLLDLSRSIRGRAFEAGVGEGNWRFLFFYVELTEGTTHRQIRVDPLNRDATLHYIDVTLGEFERRFKEYVGSTLTFVLLDSEGCYGGPIVWTPAFFSTFQARKGYDIRKFLPLLVHDGGDITPKVRNDYFDVISHMFAENYWKPIVEWGASRGVVVSGQSWGDSLQMEPAYGGDFMAMQRVTPMPFLESLFDDFRDPRQFKEVTSIAHFERQRLWCECQLVQGVESYISPQKMRYGANVIAAWGVNLWSQNTSYDEAGAEWPPQMGWSQPHWKFFHHYSDLVRRFSYMNDGGRHVADVLLFKPLSTVVAYSDPAFDSTIRNFKGRGRRGFAVFGDEAYGGARLLWGGDYSWQVETDYHAMMQRLTMGQQDFDVADGHYLKQASVEQGAVRIADESFGVFILPSVRVISRTSLDKIRRFYESGGTVIAAGSLPSGSTEHGWNDPEILSTTQAIFGVRADAASDAENSHPRGGRAFFLRHATERVVDLINQRRPADFQVVSGSPQRLFFIHRVKDGRHIYWVANDSAEPRKLTASLAAQGRPELWDPATGNRRPAAYWVVEERTQVALDMNAWDGVYIVFGEEKARPQVRLARTNLQHYSIQEGPAGPVVKGRMPATETKAYAEGDWRGKRFQAQKQNEPVAPQALSPDGWRFRPSASSVKAHYARETVVPDGAGAQFGFAARFFDDKNWSLKWLSKERWTIREWKLVGPFPNPDHEGFNEAYPPEKAIDLAAGYRVGRETITWRKYRSPTPEVNLTDALALPDREGVEYALTYVYSPAEREVTAILAAENAKMWINGALVHKMHYMPRYYELRDAYAFQPAITLRSGWNQILVKIEHCSTPYYLHRPIVFSLRLSDPSGLVPEGLLSKEAPEDPVQVARRGQEAMRGMERWYRMPIPPGTRALILPKRPNLTAIYLNGKRCATERDGMAVLAPLEWDQPNVIALELPAEAELLDFPVFQTGENLYRLGSWTHTGLTYFSGEAVYEKSFQIDPRLVGRAVELDLGQVGHTAEVWLNGRKVGERIWAPFRLDVTDYLQPGENRLRIAVTNSDANSRAEVSLERFLERKRLNLMPNVFPHMDSLALNGLIGPVQLIPYVEVELPTRAGPR